MNLFIYSIFKFFIKQNIIKLDKQNINNNNLLNFNRKIKILKKNANFFLEN